MQSAWLPGLAHATDLFVRRPPGHLQGCCDGGDGSRTPPLGVLRQVTRPAVVRDGGILRGPTQSSCKEYKNGSPDGNEDCNPKSILAKPEQKPMPQRSRQPARILMRTERMAKLKVTHRPNLRPPPTWMKMLPPSSLQCSKHGPFRPEILSTCTTTGHRCSLSCGQAQIPRGGSGAWYRSIDIGLS